MGIFDFISGKPSKEKFVKQALTAFRQAGAQGDLVYDEAEFSVKLKSLDGSEFVGNFHNIYIDYCNAKASEREENLLKYAKGMVQVQTTLPATYEVGKKKLLPLLRCVYEDIALGLMTEQTAGNTSPQTVSQPFAADIATQIGFDGEFTIMRISPSALADWGVSFEDALAQAVENLRDMTTDKWHQITPGAFVGAWSDHYDTSRALLTDCLYRLALNGDPVIIMPTRETLLVTGARDLVGQAAIVAAAIAAQEEFPRHLSMQMLRYDGKHWQEFMPDGQAGAQLKLEQLRALSGDYQQQKDMLERKLERTGEDVFVASFTCMQKNPESPVVSYAAWSEDVDSLLPKVDRLMLIKIGQGGGANQTASIPWDVAMAELGACVEKTQHQPPRYRTKVFPHAALFADLVARYPM